MDPESKKLLEATFELAEENNKMLRKVRSIQKWGVFWHSLKMILIIGVTLGAFYFLEPYVNKMVDLYNSISGTAEKLNTTRDSFQEFLKKF